jgi:hypothetical protein
MATASTASTAIKRKIARLKREMERIDAFFYTNSPDDVDLAWTLELKRDDMVQAIVLQLHTSTEDLLNNRTINRILAGRGRRSTRILLDVKDIPQVGPLQWGWITTMQREARKSEKTKDAIRQNDMRRPPD